MYDGNCGETVLRFHNRKGRNRLFIDAPAGAFRRYKGRTVFAGIPIRCRLCGEETGWVLNDAATAWVCRGSDDGDHEPTPAFGGFIATIDSVAVAFTAAHEPVEEDLNMGLGQYGRKKDRMTRREFERHFAGDWAETSGGRYRTNGEFKTWVSADGWKYIHDGNVGLRSRSWLDLAHELEILQRGRRQGPAG